MSEKICPAPVPTLGIDRLWDDLDGSLSTAFTAFLESCDDWFTLPCDLLVLLPNDGCSQHHRRSPVLTVTYWFYIIDYWLLNILILLDIVTTNFDFVLSKYLRIFLLLVTYRLSNDHFYSTKMSDKNKPRQEGRQICTMYKHI